MNQAFAGAPGRETLGDILARMRKAKKLTGSQLARLAGTSQPMISRLENDNGLPDPVKVGEIARALGADHDEVNRLVEMAELAHDRMTDWRVSLPYAHATRQGRLGLKEADRAAVRVFQPALVPGLLQTSEYARAVLTAFQVLDQPVGVPPDEAAIAATVSARIKRQEILADQTKSFRFVFLEGALGYRAAPPEHMPAQIHRIREISRQGNVSISIIPADVILPLAPLHGFELLDEVTLLVDTFNTGLTSEGRTDLRVYRQVFEMYEACATTNINQILDQHLRRSLEVLQGDQH